MKIWLPGPVYKLKPFLLLLTAAILFLIFKNTLILVASVLMFCWATYILLVRFMWADSDTIRD